MMAVGADQRKFAPVFVLGSPRSGTTLLYDMLLSSGGFAVYLAESNVFNVLAPRFGDFASRETRQRVLTAWLNSKLFRATGLPSAEIEKKILENCHNAGDFLCVVMNEMARAQGAQRWAENSPEGLLHLPAIKRQIPGALILHIIRDGRDVAMSLGKVKYVRPLPWEEHQSLLGAGAYWEWMVDRGRQYGSSFGGDYYEVHFEDVISSPQKTLDGIGRFLDHDLDYNRIRRVAYGSVTKPNTSFRAESPETGHSPVGRWKKGFTPKQLAKFERMVGETLRNLGYETSVAHPDRGTGLGLSITRQFHRSFFEAKQVFKRSSFIRALRPALTAAEIDATVLGEDHPPRIYNEDEATTSAQTTSPGMSQ
jgi:Sulfotransferase family